MWLETKNRTASVLVETCTLGLGVLMLSERDQLIPAAPSCREI